MSGSLCSYRDGDNETSLDAYDLIFRGLKKTEREIRARIWRLSIRVHKSDVNVICFHRRITLSYA
ncbi:hypothetical protein [Caballeronia pedi]|uniref:hypothetical protein n=1 Tax=Caballeronia pedi TaxID=1777141 RepID=UPI001ABF2B32|nr:hypothetical protein [Caballeronia pedi]